MPIAVDQGLEVTVKGTCLGQAVLNVFHYRPREAVTWTPQAITQFTPAWFTFWRGSILPLLVNTYTVVTYDFRVITDSIANPTPPPPGMVAFADALAVGGGASDVGGLAGPALPTLAALAWRLVSTNPTRHGRGGKRFSPLLEANSDDNEWVPTTITAWQGAIVAYIPGLADPFDSLHLDPVVFARSTYLAAVGNTFRAHSAVVTSAVLNGFVSSQVSRKQRVGAG